LASFLRTGIVAGDSQSNTGHSTGLVDQHVTSLCISVVGDQETGSGGSVGVESLHDLSSLRCDEMHKRNVPSNECSKQPTLEPGAAHISRHCKARGISLAIESPCFPLETYEMMGLDV
jgi:hypothetical protein